jgi:hypothetical protein
MEKTLSDPFEGIVFKDEPLGELSPEAQKRHEEFMTRWDRITSVVNRDAVFK